MNNLFTGKNIGILITAIALIILGYIFLAQGPVDNPLSVSIAPIILVISYCVIIPIAIIRKDKKD